MAPRIDLPLRPLLLMVIATGAASIIDVSRTDSEVSQKLLPCEQLNLFGDALDLVRSKYVERPDDGTLIQAAIKGMLAALDPRASYLKPERTQRLVQLSDLGLEVTMEDRDVKVVSPIEDTSAAKGGLLANDLITRVDGEEIGGLTLEEVIEKTRGPVGTSITLTIVREGVEDPFDVKLARDIIRVNPVKIREQGDVAYIKISSFNEQTNGELVSAIENAKKSIGHKLKGYVIDLRNNPGGLLDQAILVSSDFLNAGTIVLIKGRNNDETTGASSHPGDITDGKRIVVLINGGSASASEIVAGALQDHKRATVIGTHSFGIGSAQTTISLGVNGAIRLTTARYYRPSGSSIDEGIEPDVVVEEEIPDRLSAGKAADESRAEADLRKQDIDDDSAEMGETGSSGYVAATPETDAQLQYALGLLSGRLIQPALGRDKKPAATFRLSPGPQGAQGSHTVTQLVAPSGASLRDGMGERAPFS